MTHRYYILDVFTTRRFAGNPLAVVLNADGLDDARMQTIAREFNLSETVFVLEPRDPVNTARARIFTPQSELPFAGHPTIGTAILLAELRAKDHVTSHELGIVLEEAVGAIKCGVWRHDGVLRARFGLPQLPQAAGDAPGRAAIAAALDLDERDIGFGAHRPLVQSAGVPFTFVPVASRHAVTRAAPVPGAFEHAFSNTGAAKAFVYTADTVDPTHAYHARMFAPGLGIREDPATGSAVAAFAGIVMAFDAPGDGDHTFVVEQGYAMGRPSLITLGLGVERGILREASIAGAAVIVADGTIDLT